MSGHRRGRSSPRRWPRASIPERDSESLPEPPPVVAPEPGGDPGPITRVLQLGVTVGGAAAAPLAAIGLRTTEAAGALMRRAALRQVAPGRRSLERLGRELEQVGASWDGRLSVAAVEVESGRRVMFGSPGAPTASVADAVQASCAIPGVFRPVVVDGRSYVDGGVWSPTNLDRAPAARGTRVLCLNPTGSMRPRADAPFGMVGPVSRALAESRRSHSSARRAREHGVARCGDTGRDGPEPHGCRSAVAGDRGGAGAGPGAGWRATGMSAAPSRTPAPAAGDAQDESLTSVLVALAANTTIAAAKGIAAALTGSPALFAETLHTVADAGNEVFLYVAIRRSRRPPDALHPFGHGPERYFWALLAAIGIFLVGGTVSILEGIRALLNPPELDAFWVGVASSWSPSSWTGSVGPWRCGSSESRRRGAR